MVLGVAQGLRMGVIVRGRVGHEVASTDAAQKLPLSTTCKNARQFSCSKPVAQAIRNMPAGSGSGWTPA